jgi:hypothetical protein
MKHLIKLLLLPALLGWMTASCIDEDETPAGVESGLPVTLSLSTALNESDTRIFDEGENGSPEDRKIVQFRVLAFNATTGVLAHNAYISNTPDIVSKMPLLMKMYAGSYDFVFIANEASDPALAGRLAAYHPGGKSLSDIENESFASTAFSATANIPMSAFVKNVEVVGDKQYKLNGVSHTGTWPVIVTRLAIRVDVRLFTGIAQRKDNCTGLEFYNLPNTVPVLAQRKDDSSIYNGGTGHYEASSRTVATNDADNGTGFTVTIPPTPAGWEWVKSRIILPSSVFSASGTKANAIQAKVKYASGNDSQFVLAPGTATNFVTPRNNYYTVDATLVYSGTELFIAAQDWTQVAVSANMEEKRLNVEFIETTVSNKSQMRIYFWTNQPTDKVYVGQQGYEADGTTPFTVNDVFDDLSDPAISNPYCNLHYNSVDGLGYIDIVPKGSSLTSGIRYIYLNAGGLRRRIKVTVNAVSGYPMWATSKYMGAFWRNNQTGERLITGANTGEWTAEIEDPSGQGSFVVLAKGRTSDQSIWTANPADPENFQVSGDETVITGTGEIAFRIGLKSKFTPTASPEVNARYARVKVTTTGGDSYVYIRQGEQADYLMRNDNAEDMYYSSVTGNTLRARSVKFSPFNLTDPAATANGGTTATNHNTVAAGAGVFVKYPSQAGCFFQWGFSSSGAANVRAYHPVNPGSSYITSWPAPPDGSTNTNHWTSSSSPIGTTSETCPSPYRRPSDGATNDEVETITIGASELRQSLWLDPQTSSTSNNNTLWGFYADGFFDRRIILNSTTVSYNSATLADPINRQVAYIGRLFYNQNSNASLFLPAPGWRVWDQFGILQQVGSAGYYWTSSTFDDPQSGRMLIMGSNTVYAGGGRRSYGLSLRCVQP